MNVLLLVLLAGLMHATRSFRSGEQLTASDTALALGYLLVTGYFAGLSAKAVRLPKLTGYLVVGALIGPDALGLVSQPMVESLSLVNGMAVSMIALTAGTELELSRIRPLARTVAAITGIAVLGTTCLLTLVSWLCRPLLPFLSALPSLPALAVASVLGVVMVAQSPAVVVALRDELRADGPVARTALAVVVLADLVVIFLFAILSTVTKAVLGGSADVTETLAMLAWEIVGSLVAGSLLGGLLVLYVRKVGSGTALFLLAITFIVAEVGGRLHFDPLLVSLAAGALARNASDAADALHERLQISALSVYVLFFCVAGASLHLDALASVWIPATLIVLTRGAGLLLGTRLAAEVAGAPIAVKRFAGFGLLPQAGLALALSLLFARTFPELGEQARALTLSVVALNELLAPIAFRWALTQSGEVGREARRGTPLDAGAELEPEPLDFPRSARENAATSGEDAAPSEP